MPSQVNFGVSADPGSSTDNTDTVASGTSIYGFSPKEAPVPVPFMVPDVASDQDLDIGTNHASAPPMKEGTLPFSEAMSHYSVLHATDPKGFASFQEQLYRGGYYDKYLKNGEQPKLGVWDATTRKATHDMLADSVASGQMPDEMMAEAAQANAGQGGQGKSKTPPRITNPAVISAEAKNLSSDVLGYRADDVLANQVADKYEGLAQQDVQSTQDPSQAGNVEYGYRTGVNQAWLEEQLRDLRPKDAQTYNALKGQTMILKMLSSPTGSL